MRRQRWAARTCCARLRDAADRAVERRRSARSTSWPGLPARSSAGSRARPSSAGAIPACSPARRSSACSACCCGRSRRWRTRLDARRRAPRRHPALARRRAQPSLHDAPAEWCARARRECAGAALLLGRGLRAAAARRARRAPSCAAPLTPPATRSRASTPSSSPTCCRGRDRPTPAAPKRSTCCCAAAISWRSSADELERLALERMAEEERPRWRSARAPRRRARRSAQPTPRRRCRIWRVSPSCGTRRATRPQRADVLTFPDWPVRYVDQPRWAREAAPYLYFLPYRSPAPFDAAPVVDYFVPPAPTTARSSSTTSSTTAASATTSRTGTPRARHRASVRSRRSTARRGSPCCAAARWPKAGRATPPTWPKRLGLLTPAESFAQHSRSPAHGRARGGRYPAAPRPLVARRMPPTSTRAGRHAAGRGTRRSGQEQPVPGRGVHVPRSAGTASGVCGASSLPSRKLRSAHFHDRLLSFGSVPVLARGAGDARTRRPHSATSERRLSQKLMMRRREFLRPDGAGRSAPSDWPPVKRLPPAAAPTARTAGAQADNATRRCPDHSPRRANRAGRRGQANHRARRGTHHCPGRGRSRRPRRRRSRDRRLRRQPGVRPELRPRRHARSAGHQLRLDHPHHAQRVRAAGLGAGAGQVRARAWPIRGRSRPTRRPTPSSSRRASSSTTARRSTPTRSSSPSIASSTRPPKPASRTTSSGRTTTPRSSTTTPSRSS